MMSARHTTDASQFGTELFPGLISDTLPCMDDFITLFLHYLFIVQAESIAFPGCKAVRHMGIAHFWTFILCVLIQQIVCKLNKENFEEPLLNKL